MVSRFLFHIISGKTYAYPALVKKSGCVAGLEEAEEKRIPEFEDFAEIGISDNFILNILS